MNLIVTCARNLEGEAEEEIMDILDELGDPDVKISVSNMSGIITVLNSDIFYSIPFDLV